MTQETILVLADPDDPHIAKLRRRLSSPKLVVGKTVTELSQDASDASVLFNWTGALALFREVFALCRNLRWVHSRNVGVEKTLFPELIESNVPLTNGVGVFSPALGEFVLGAILYFAKDFRRMIRNQMAGRWEEFDVTPIAGQTLGIVGYGDIGREIAKRACPIGMKVLAVRRHTSAPRPSDQLVENVYPPEQRLEMISRCDYVVVAAPLTAETQGMIGKTEIAAMKRSAVIINVGRGPIISEEALLEALTSNRIKGAALDVFDQEPLPPGHLFYKLENVLLSPHTADHTPDWLDNSIELFLEQFVRYKKGEPLLNVVNKKLGY
jgi:phosphoglycerate dehydrogenase-like enzyme